MHVCLCAFARFADVPQPELMLTTTRGRATVAGLDSTQEYNLQVLLLNGTTEKLLAKRRFTSKRRRVKGGERGRGRVRYMRKNFCFMVKKKRFQKMYLFIYYLYFLGNVKICPTCGCGYNSSFYLQKNSNLSSHRSFY